MSSIQMDKDSSPLWTFICIFMFFFLIIDVFYSFVDGETIKMRNADYFYFNESPIFFIFTVTIKLILLLYCSFYLYKRLIHYKGILKAFYVKKRNIKNKKDKN